MRNPWVAEDTAGCRVDIACNAIENRPLKVRGLRKCVGPISERHKHLAHMAEDELQVGMTIEGAGENHAERG